MLVVGAATKHIAADTDSSPLAPRSAIASDSQNKQFSVRSVPSSTTLHLQGMELPNRVKKYDKMIVIKRDGTEQRLSYDKVTLRIAKLCFGLHASIDASAVAQKVIAGLYSGIHTHEIDQLAASEAAHKTYIHPDYDILAGRIAVTDLHRSTSKRFSDVVEKLMHNKHPVTGKSAPLVSDELYSIVQAHKARLDATIVQNRDMKFGIFGIATLKRAYLLKVNNEIAERPQHMYMRVAIGIHGDDIDSVVQTYHDLSKGRISHASPTMFQGGTPNQQLLSCFLLGMEDSIQGIYKTLTDCAMIARKAGGIGFSTSDIRASQSYIAGTNGSSNGLVPMLRVYNATGRYVDQGGNKRPGAFASYLEPWHADVLEWLDLRTGIGAPENKAKDLFYGLWVPDLFMERVEACGKWTLMCPAECPGLTGTWGPEFKTLYERYEAEGRGRRTIDAQTLWFHIIEAQRETGMPYMLYKDTCNAQSNQQNLGTIKCSNLCTEIIEYSSKDEVACCVLGSICVNEFVDAATATYDFKALEEQAYRICKNLNKVIDRNTYDLPEQKRSNFRHRPIGIGFQGFADAFVMMRLPWEMVTAEGKRVPHPGSELLNKQIVETTYHGAIRASIDLAKQDGHYETYPGSPLSQGKLQFDLAGVAPTDLWDWAPIRAGVAAHGTRNSLLLAPMPTASTAQILGNTEGIEPFHNNVYKRQVLSGEHPVVNKHMVADLDRLGMWTDQMRRELRITGGSLQSTDAVRTPLIATIPLAIKELYKTVWEISQGVLIDLAADRSHRICQSQSFSIHFRDPKDAQITTAHFRGWKKKLKTGMYYLRTRPAVDAIDITHDATAAATTTTAATTTSTDADAEAALACSRANPETCDMCVVGHTQVLTTEGPQNIDALARIREDEQSIENMERRARAIEDVAECRKRIDAAKTSKARKRFEKDLQAFEAIVASCGNPENDAPRKTTADPIEVWNGHGWSQVVCRKTSDNAELMRITTSHGTVLTLTPAHTMIMRDGVTRKPVGELALGDALVPTPPVVYEGIAKLRLPNDLAFRLGFIYGFALANNGGSMALRAPVPNELKFPVLRIRKATVSDETLDLLKYDMERVRAINPKENHDALAFIGIPPDEQQIRVLPRSPIDTRLHWVRGLIAATGAQLGCESGHLMITRAVDMLRSVGEDVRMARTHEHELWQLKWPSSKEGKMKPVGEVALLKKEVDRMPVWLAEWKAKKEADKIKAEEERSKAKAKSKADAINKANTRTFRKKKNQSDDDAAAAADTDKATTADDTANVDAPADAPADTADDTADAIAPRAPREPPVPMPDEQPPEVDPPTIIGIERLGHTATTYCFTEPERHAGVFNNQLTGQCSA